MLSIVLVIHGLAGDPENGDEPPLLLKTLAGWGVLQLVDEDPEGDEGLKALRHSRAGMVDGRSGGGKSGAKSWRIPSTSPWRGKSLMAQFRSSSKLISLSCFKNKRDDSYR